MSFKCDRGPIFQVTNMNRNLTQFRATEIHCQPDPRERNCSLRHVTTKTCVDRLENNLRKRVFHQAKLEILTLKYPSENQCVVAS